MMTRFGVIVRKFGTTVMSRHGSVVGRLLVVAERTHWNVTRYNSTDTTCFAKYVVVKRIYVVGSRICVRRCLVIGKTANAMNAKSRRFVDVNYPTGAALLLVSVDKFKKTFKVRHQVETKRKLEMVRPKGQFT